MSSGRPEDESVVGVVTVDDHRLCREALSEVIETTPGLVSLGAAASGVEALDLLDRVHASLVFVDVRMPGMDGIETARRIHFAHPDTAVVLMSENDAADLPDAAATCGAVRVVRKERITRNLLRTLAAATAP